METKKSKRFELEPHKGTWFLAGVIIALAFMFISFEWTEFDKSVNADALANDPVFVEMLVPITFPEVKPPPPPPALASAEVISIVESNSELPETTIASSEYNSDPIDIGSYIPPKIEEDIIDETEIFVIVDNMPEFPGGQKSMLEYLSKSIRYPIPAQEMNIQGRVIVQFVVDKDGSITDPVVVRSVDPNLDKEALRVVQSMPKWKPGMQRNTPVRVKYTLPVTFRLK